MALFLEVADLAEMLAGEAGRLKKRAAIAAAISRVAAQSVEEAGLLAMYVAGTPFAEADARKLNAGGALLSKALLAVSGASAVELAAAYRRFGDMGAAAFELLAGEGGRASHDAHLNAIMPREDGAPNSIEAPEAEGGLRLGEVAEVFAGMAGARTTAARLELVQGLLRRAGALEAKYLLKLMLGDMRIGVKQSLVEEAIAVAAGVEVAAVRHAVMLEADLAGAVRRAFEGTLREAAMRLFHPLGFMLASPVETSEEAVERFSGKKRESADFGRDGDAAKVGFADSHLNDDGTVVKMGHPDLAEDDGTVAKMGHSNSERIEAFLEDKYDGMRAQVHCGDAAQVGRVAIYSRNKEEVTESFPELAEAFALVTSELVGAAGGGLVFDGEILGWDLKAARALPFAVLGQRIGRKRVSNEMRRAVPVVFMAFDLMVMGGELLLELPLRERRNRLEAVVERLVERVVSPVEVAEVRVSRRKKLEGQAEMFGGFDGDGTGVLHPTHREETAMNGPPNLSGSSGMVERLMISPSRLVESAEDIERAYADARARANEGVMLKAVGSVYQPGRRGLAWVKLKRELATLDVVVTGAEFGHGRRAGILSDYTFAVRDGDGELQNVGKAYSGLTDAEILEMSAWMMAHTLEDQGHFRTVEPLMVLEVAFNNVMRSGRHASGFALRFPRILRIRTDKPLSEIDTVERVEEIYQSQVDKPVE